MFNSLIMDDILKIVHDYTNRGLYLDGEALNKITDIFCKVLSLQNYIKDLKYTDFSKTSKVINSYNVNNREILFNYGINLSRSIDEVDFTSGINDSRDRILAINLSILSKLIKQISKSYYLKGCFKSRKYLDQLLCKASFEGYVLKEMPISNDERCKSYIYLSNVLYNNNDETPANRMSRIAGLIYANNLANQRVLTKSKLVRNYQEKKFIREALKDYHFLCSVNSPTINYFEDKASIMDKTNFKTPLYDVGTALCTLHDESLRLDLYNKLYYGLNLDEDDQKVLFKKIK